VIIGNPPYVELKVVNEYRAINFACQSAGNLYALVIERCLRICSRSGREGFIVPVSSVSTDRYSSLQKLITDHHLYYSSFDDRPSRLFDGLEHNRLTIHLISKALKSPTLFSTKYNKWISSERPILFEKLIYFGSKFSLVNGSLPKLSSEIEEEIVRKLYLQGRALKTFFVKISNNIMFYSRKLGYFLQVLDFEPQVFDGDGNLRPPSEFKRICFSDSSHAKVALCALNSNLFYWFVTVFSDCRHVNKREVEAFPIDLQKVAKGGHGASLIRLSNDLMAELKKNSESKKMQFKHDTLSVQCIFPKQSKAIIDEIDRVLAKHFGFTDEELDFIINYDIKYRMGPETQQEE
jgi:hypothetical protein